MADPISALSAATAALQLGQIAMQTGSYLYKLAKAISKVDQTVSNLAAEAKAVSQVCDLIDQEIKALSPAQGSETIAPYDEHEYLWRSVILQVEETQGTISDLKGVIGEDERENGDFFQRARKQMHLEKNKDELEGIWRRMHTHTQSLQMALQMVNIKVSYLAPKIAADDLGVKLEDLKKGVQALQLELRTSNQKGITPSEVQLIQCAKDIMRSGKTLCEESLAGDSTQGGENAARINRLVAEWAGDVESLRRDTERTGLSSTDTLVPTVFSDDTLPSTDSATSASDENLHERYGTSDGEDDDLSFEVAAAALEQGRVALEQEDWREAESVLKEALKEIKSLPPRRRAGFDVFELEYNLTMCACHTREPAIAKEALMSIVGQTPASDENKKRLCDAAHMLAQLHLQESELESARMICESTLKARSKLLGRTHESYLESLALMAHLYVLLGNAPRARIFTGMIPETHRKAFSERFQLDSTKQAMPHADNARFILSSDTYRHSHRSLVPNDSDKRSLESLPDLVKGRPYSGTTISSTRVLNEPPRPAPRRTPPPLPVPRRTPPPLPAPGRILPAIPRRPVTSNVPTLPLIDPGEHTDAETTHDYSQPDLDTETDESIDFGASEARRNLVGRPDAIDTATRRSMIDAVGRSSEGELERAICEDRHEDALATLLYGDVDTDMRKSNSFALHYAAMFGNVDVASALVSRGWNVNARIKVQDAEPMTPLHFAMGYRQSLFVQWLLRHDELRTPKLQEDHPVGMVFSNSKLFVRQPTTDPDAIISCISQAFDGGFQADQRIGDRTLTAPTPLSQVISQPVPSMLDPIEISARNAVVNFLLESGASRLKRTGGRTLLSETIRAGNSHFLPLLLSQDADQQLPARCEEGGWVANREDALCYAIRLLTMPQCAFPWALRDCVAELVKAGADMYSTNEILERDLSESLRSKSRFKKLVESTIRRTVTPWDLAMASGDSELIQIMTKNDQGPRTKFDEANGRSGGDLY